MLVVSHLSAYAFNVPPYAGFVTDRVGVLSTEQQQTLESRLQTYQQETSNEIAILIISTLDGESIVDAAVETGRQWGVGSGDKDNGILLLIAIEDRQMFLATGYGLEGAVPDITAKNIIDTKIAPEFRNGDYFEGITAGITALEQAIGGEYTVEESSGSDIDFMGVMFFVIFFVFPWMGAILGRTKSWWLGGVLGVAGGILFWVIFSALFAIPLFGIIGLVFDYLVSKNYKSNKRNSWWSGGGWGPGGGGGMSSGGGFGGFSGGSFGGGGARGGW